MGYFIGTLLALAVALFGKSLGFEKEKSFYSVILIVVASYYVLFAALTGATGIIIAESIPAALFVVAAAVGFKKTLWVVVAGLALHGAFDSIHHEIIVNHGVPSWWPPFCLSFDLTAAIYLGVVVYLRRGLDADARA